MRTEFLSYLHCPHCQADLAAPAGVPADMKSGLVHCTGCGQAYPVLGGVLILVRDVRRYLVEHVAGISRYVTESEIPKEHRSAFAKARREIQAEHIAEDLEAERVNALYLMTHYLASAQVRSPSPVIADLVRRYWGEGPFPKINELLLLRKAKGSMVELGCGVGGLLRTLEPALNSYLGVDFSFASIYLARWLNLEPKAGPRTVKIPEDLLFGTVSREIEIPPRRAQGPRAEFVVCDLEAPPLKSSRWDLCAALNVIDMLPEPASLPALQHELLAPGGTAIQSCPYIWHEHISEELRLQLPRSIRDSAGAVEWLYSQAGFRIEQSVAHVPWVFFKNVRQVELYSVHLFLAVK